MKRILASFLVVFVLFATACASLTPSPTPSEDPNSGNAGGEQSNIEKYIYVGYRYLQDNGDNYDYVTQKVPIVAVNKLGEYLVDIDWGEESSSETNTKNVDLYLTDLHAESYADDFVYKTLKKSAQSHTLMYVTEEQYQKLLQWSLPEKLIKIIDLTQTDDYKQHGYLKLESNKIPFEDVFG